MALILIAEDDKTTLEILALYIKKLGQIPIKCRDGLAAWNFLQDNNDIIKAVITDLMMPNMDGYSLMEKIRSHEKMVNLPIIVQSDYLGVKGAIELMEKGASCVFPKPMEFSDLKEHIQAYIKKSNVTKVIYNSSASFRQKFYPYL